MMDYKTLAALPSSGLPKGNRVSVKADGPYAMWSGNTCVSSDNIYELPIGCLLPAETSSFKLVVSFLVDKPPTLLAVAECIVILLIDCSMSSVFGPSCWLLLVAVTCL